MFSVFQYFEEMVFFRYITIAPRHYCTIKHPVVKEDVSYFNHFSEIFY